MNLKAEQRLESEDSAVLWPGGGSVLGWGSAGLELPPESGQRPTGRLGDGDGEEQREDTGR